MGTYRFSPIQNTDEMLLALRYIHGEGHRICRQLLGAYLPVAGNIGIFCHDEEEYRRLTDIRKELTDASISWNNKYFKLYTPLSFPRTGETPDATYTYLYIRKPEAAQARVGDVDFYLDQAAYSALKTDARTGKKRGVSVFERPDLDLVRLDDPNSDVSVFVGSYVLNDVARHADPIV